MEKKMKQISKILFIGLSVLVLAACSTTGSNNGMNNAASNGAMASGVAGQQQFDGSAYANRLKAPYDQVYHFAFDSDAVSNNAAASIKVQAKYLINHPNARVRLDGNTDERGSREYNVALGWRRAKAVASILKQYGVAPRQLVLNSFGEEKPVAFCHNESCYKLNRRVNLTYEAK